MFKHACLVFCLRWLLAASGMLAPLAFCQAQSLPWSQMQNLMESEPPSAGAEASAMTKQRWASLAEPVFQNLLLARGIPPVLSYSLVQDNDGYMWLGTQGGLYRWDGYRYRSYDLYGTGKDAIAPIGWVESMRVDSRGELWAGTISNGLAHYDKARDVFDAVPGFGNAAITSIADDRHGGLWLATGDGLAHYSIADGKVVFFHHDSKQAGSLPDNTVSTVLCDRDGLLWAGTDQGLVRRSADIAVQEDFVAQELPFPKGHSKAMAFLMESSDGRIWVGTQHGVFVLEKNGEYAPTSAPTSASASASAMRVSVRSLIEPGASAMKPIGDWISSMAEANSDKGKGDIWISTYGQGLIEVDATTMRTRRIHSDPLLPTSLLHDYATTVISDRSGLLWVSNARGISILDPNQRGVMALLGVSSRKVGLSNGDVQTVVNAADGRIWLGMLKNGLDIINPEQGTIASLRRELGYVPNQEPDVARPQVTALAKLNDGTMAVGTDDGMYLSDREGKSLRRYTWPARSPTDRVQVFMAENNTLWIGGWTDGVWMLDQKNIATVKPVHPTWSDQLTDKRVLAITSSNHGQLLWVGTQSGLNVYDHLSGKLEHIMPDSADPDALSTAFISSILVDSKDRVWVGTYDGGINLLLGRNANGRPRFRHIGTAQGLPHANVDKMMEDSAGNIWVGTDNGLARIDGTSFAVEGLRAADGAVITNYYLNAGAQTDAQELIFGGLGGVTIVKPEQYRQWTYRPPVVVTEIRVQGKRVSANQFNGLTTQRGNQASNVAPLQISADENSFAVEFAALDYSAPELNRYSYLLEGYDKAWVDTDATRRQVAYTNLPPGDYRLRLRGSNRNGIWNEKELAIPIRVLPAWYQSWWARLLEALLVVAVLVFIVQGRTRFLRMRQLDLEQQVKDRTTELVAQRDLLELQKLAVEREKIDAEHQKDIAQHQRALVFAAHSNINLLSDIGRQITATLDLDEVMMTIYRNVAVLMDAGNFSIGVVDEMRKRVDFTFVVEKGKLMESPLERVDDLNELATWCVNRKAEVFINDIDTEYARYFPDDLPPALALESVAGVQGPFSAAMVPRAVSLLYVPVHLKGKVMGVIAVKSGRKNAYTRMHLDMLVTLASYTAIALDNADAYRQLGKALESLKSAQQQLVLQEKMASLGTLTSGVAHEINNPTNFAHAGAMALNIQLEKFRQQLLEMANEDDVEIHNYLREKFNDLIEQVDTIVEGTSRIRDLVRDLSAFSRLGEAEWKKVPICSSLLSTINLVRTQFSDSVDIRCDLQENPILECRPAQMNQVFMNLIVNACQAIQSRQVARIDKTAGVLNIRSRITGRELAIEFEDNGCGIPAGIVDRIFDPFFTTKDVGQGTGLGLSISFGIVEAHKGKLVVHSVEGVGTCFIVKLPLEEVDANAAFGVGITE